MGREEAPKPGQGREGHGGEVGREVLLERLRDMWVGRTIGSGSCSRKEYNDIQEGAKP